MIKYYEDFLRILAEYGIDKSAVCIVGSGVLADKGLRENHDFDFAVTPEERAKLLKRHGKHLKVLSSGTICFTEDIQILQNRYGIVGVTDDMLFTDVYSIPYGDMRIATIEIEIAKKIRRYAKKDIIDLDAICVSGLSIDWLSIYNIASENKKAPTKGVKQIIRAGKNKLKSVLGHVGSGHRVNLECGVPAVETGFLLNQCYRKKRFDIFIAIMYLRDMYPEQGNQILLDKYNIDERILKMRYENHQRNAHNTAIRVNDDMLLSGECYDLAIAAACGNAIVPVHVVRDKQKAGWKGADECEIECIDSILTDTGAYFCAIIWPTMKSFYPEIESFIGSQYRIVETGEIKNLDMDSFITDIYSIDGIELWKINLKQRYMSSLSPSVQYVVFDIPDPEWRKSERTGFVLSGASARLKKAIRDTYKTKVDNYIYDVVIHTGDNPHINSQLIKILRRYSNKEK